MQSLPFTVLWGRTVHSRESDKSAVLRNKNVPGLWLLYQREQGNYTYSFESICFENRRGYEFHSTQEQENVSYMQA